MRFVFLHGGPGFSSFAEQAIFAPAMTMAGRTIDFWNEPSALRPDGDPFVPEQAFANWLASAERFTLEHAAEPVHVVTHSVTMHAGLEIARRHPERVASLCLLGPGADLFATFTNVMRIARDDLAATRPDVSARIADCMVRTRVFMDAAMHEGLLQVLHDDRLFTHYWADPAQMDASMTARSSPEAQFDPDSFFAVMADFAARGRTLLADGPVRMPVLALFGDSDGVTPIDAHRAALTTLAPSITIETVERCGHYLHLDRPHAVADRLAAWAANVPAN